MFTKIPPSCNVVSFKVKMMHSIYPHLLHDVIQLLSITYMMLRSPSLVWLYISHVTNASVTSQTGEQDMASRIRRRRLSVFGHVYADSQKRHQPTPRYAWPWTLEPVTDPTTDRSGNADEDDPAERACSRLEKTVGLTSTTLGGSRMTASLGGRYESNDPSPVKRPSEWVTITALTELEYLLDRLVKVFQWPVITTCFNRSIKTLTVHQNTSIKLNLRTVIQRWQNNRAHTHISTLFSWTFHSWKNTKFQRFAEYDAL